MSDLEEQKATVVETLSQISTSRNAISVLEKEIEGLKRRTAQNGIEQREAEGALGEMEKLLSQAEERMKALTSSMLAFSICDGCLPIVGH